MNVHSDQEVADALQECYELLLLLFVKKVTVTVTCVCRY